MDAQKKSLFDGDVDGELLSEPSQTFALTILISLLVVFLTIFILWWIKRRPGSYRRGECLLLCGSSNSGKTLLFCRFTMGLAKRTITSMATNKGSMTLENSSSDRPWKKIHVIDIPGNLRIRQRDFNTNKSSAKAIIFVIDSTTIKEETAGHSMNECTAEIPDELKQKREVKTGICYKCGSTEHRLNQCTVKGDSFAYATCFVCGKQGHWSRLCPDNPNGLYPNGGCCNECGSKQHFKRDCPTLLKKQGIDDQQLTCLTATTSNIDDNVELVTVKPVETKKKSLKRLKIVKF
ncbi:unnamed protein product [Rotaria magnacalcarata]|uniref:Signal recognition particle receptor subunit beta n=1 Tax=Rotaria magnacalcarata TaxID=392030 RepID=A0A8S2K939_9BILA|nr:unnamed protein product [Rotaria magnacalcarata]